MAVAGLTRLALHRMRHDVWLYLILLLGWIAATALGAAVPVYVDALHQRVLRLELQEGSHSHRPAFGFLFLSLDRDSSSTLIAGDAQRLSEYDRLASYMDSGFTADMALPVTARMHYVRSDLFQLFPTGAGTYGRGDEPLEHFSLGFLSNLAGQAELLSGHLPVSAAPDASHVEVLMHQDMANRLGVQAGEDYVVFRAANPNPATGERAFALPVRIAGIWRAADPASAYWYLSPTTFANSLLTSEAQYRAEVAYRIPRPYFETGWYTALDGGDIRAGQIDGLVQRIHEARAQVQQHLPGTLLMLSPENALLRYRLEVAEQSPLLLFASLPVLLLVLLYTGMTTRSLMMRQQREIAVLRSRGASRFQVLGTYAIQLVVLSGFSLLAGLPGSLAVTRLMASASFWVLPNVHNAPVVLLDAALTPDAPLYAGAVLGLVNLTSMAAGWRYARETAVTSEQRLSREETHASSTWIVLDLAVAGASAYGWYLLRQEGGLPLPDRLSGIDFADNPLVFLTPCLWLWTGVRAVVRLLPWLLRGLDWPVQLLRGTVLLVALRNLARQAPHHQALLTLLLFAMGTGTLAASIMRTQDAHLEDKAYYTVGSSVNLTEQAKRFQGSDDGDTAGQPTGWSIPPFDLHRNAPGVVAAARVGIYPVSLRIDNRGYSAKLYGIDRTEWPQTAYFRPDFAAEPLGELMNRLALNPNGLLVPTHLLEAGGYGIGDEITVQGLIAGSGAAVPFRIVGSLRYFPTTYPPDELFVVGNLEHIFTQVGGPMPYQVWLRLADRARTGSVVAALDEASVEILDLADAKGQLETWRTDPVRLGLNGFLSLGLGVGLVLGVLALVVHGILALQRRRMQIGTLRAIGWSRGQGVLCIALEQLAIAALGMGGGTMLGVAVSRLFVPYLQTGLAAAQTIPPYVVRTSWDEFVVAAAVLLGAVGVLTVAVSVILARSNLFQVLKAGELEG